MTTALLGLTGGIGSGKSTVGAMLADLGAYVVDADQVAREIVAPGTEGLGAIVARWGGGVLQADGQLNRGLLATIIFADPLERKALEAITHPRIIAESNRLLAASPALIGVHMAALLIEAGAWQRCDAIWVTQASEELRLMRVIARDGGTEAMVRARMGQQMSEDERARYADRLIDTECGIQELHGVVEREYAELVEAVRAGCLAEYRRRTAPPSSSEPGASSPD